MKVAYGSWDNRPTFKCGRDVATTGYDNLPMFCDGYWHNLFALRESGEAADLVLCASPPMESFPRLSKPPQWGKLFMLQEAGFGVVNTHYYLNALSTSPFDGYLLHNRRLVETFEVLGKSVYYFKHPYDWEKAEACNVGPRLSNRVLVNLSRYLSPEGNITGTLAVIRRMPHVQFEAFFEEPDPVSDLTSRLGIKNLRCHAPVGWLELLRKASQFSAFLSMDNRTTIGRFCFDAAALSIPCVGVYSEAQEEFFPQFQVAPTDISGAVQTLSEALCLNGVCEVPSFKKEPHGLPLFAGHFQKLCDLIIEGER